MISKLGNNALMNRHRVAFFAPSTTESLSVMPALDWASEIAKRGDVTVCSGFQSPLEKLILPYLLRGKCGIIVALNRGVYEKVPERYRAAFDDGRILFVSLLGEDVTLPSRAAGLRRNRYLADLADKIVIPFHTSSTSLSTIAAAHPSKSTFLDDFGRDA